MNFIKNEMLTLTNRSYQLNFLIIVGMYVLHLEEIVNIRKTGNEGSLLEEFFLPDWIFCL